MRVDLVRLESSDDHGTFGTLLIDGEAFCVTLEPVDLNNIAYLSCIPTGVYLCKAHNSPTYGKTFLVTDVPHRENVLFHAGNRDENTAGCILLGQYYGKLKTDRAILNSGDTFKAFLERMWDVESFALNISEALHD
jgi:hypothetical protein